jgi:hypothetical protein
LSQQGTGGLQTGILIDLDQPDLELSIDDEIHPEELKTKFPLVSVDLLLY